MRQTPIPQRIAPLAWRTPAFVWTPLALALAVGGPAVLFKGDGALAQVALIAGALIYAVALTSLGAAWLFGRPPRTRRDVVVHVLLAGAAASLLAPFLLTQLLALVADYAGHGGGEAFSFAMSVAMAPLALVLGLPVTLATAIAFSLIALRRPPAARHEVERDDVQPFR